MDNVCRTCLRTSKELLPLFNDTKLQYKIKTISSVEVSEDDNLPNKICAACIVNINLSYNFRRVIINSDMELRDRYRLKQKEQYEDKINDDTDPSETSFIKCENLALSDDGEDGNDYHVDDTSLIKEDNDVFEIEINNDLITEDTNTIQEESNVTFKDSKNKLFKCDKCNYESSERRKYTVHLQNHSMRMCTICGKFISALNLKKHISIHTDSPVECKECGKVCKNSESLRGHVIIHKGINRKCKICGEVYKKRAAYVAHVKTHKSEDEKSVRCPLCNKRLHGKRGLQKHIRSHTGERPYPCEFCKKGFSSSHALKTHRRQHTNERPYKCELCPMAFSQKVSLHTHLKSKHQIKTTNDS